MCYSRRTLHFFAAFDVFSVLRKQWQTRTLFCGVHRSFVLSFHVALFACKAARCATRQSITEFRRWPHLYSNTDGIEIWESGTLFHGDLAHAGWSAVVAACSWELPLLFQSAQRILTSAWKGRADLAITLLCVIWPLDSELR